MDKTSFEVLVSLVKAASGMSREDAVSALAREDIYEPNSIVADAVASEAKPTPPDRGQ